MADCEIATFGTTKVLVGDLLDLTPEVIGRVEGEIPAAYPAMLADRIFAGLREGIKRLRTRD